MQELRRLPGDAGKGAENLLDLRQIPALAELLVELFDGAACGAS